MKPAVPENALLVGLCITHTSGRNVSASEKTRRRAQAQDDLDELQRLAESAGAMVVGRILQERDRPEPSTFIGKGKVEALAQQIIDENVQLVVFDDVLSPAQNRNLETELKCKVLDRTGLILDIFAARARTREGIVQVELAQMEYLYPRLVGMWMHFSRQQGGIGMRGPGETQLEVDRRKVRERMTFLAEKLVKIRQDRNAQREKRKGSRIPMVSLVGYTNAGKSTLLNALAGTEEYTDDRLFATLDPVTRRVDLAPHWTVLVSDTVGLIKKLPHELVAAFRATFEEIADSDLLLHVVDLSSPQAEEQEAAVLKVLADFECEKLPRLTVYNKIDAVGAPPPTPQRGIYHVSAIKGEGIDALRDGVKEALENRWPLHRVRLAPNQGGLRAQLFREATVISEKMDGEMLELELRLPAEKVYLIRDCETLPKPRPRIKSRR